MSKISVKYRLRKVLPSMQIHVWGGLGSQLFALLAIEEIQNRFSFRNVKVVFHSSGITARFPDLVDLIPPKICTKFVDDFIYGGDSPTFLGLTGSKLGSKNSVFKALARRLRIIVTWDEPDSSPKFWTLQVRGHYRMMRVSLSSLEGVFLRISTLKLNSCPSKTITANAIHFRIGDLVGLKGIINPDDLLVVAKEIQIRNRLKFTVLSDSGQAAAIYLSNLDLNPTNHALGTWETIRLGFDSDSFIGTFSKISYWIVILRVLENSQKANFLPEPVAEEIRNFFAHYGITANIKGYRYSLVNQQRDET
jgi:hypothetical protein